MLLTSPFLPATRPCTTWAPSTYASPCFNHTESLHTAKCLSLTQLALDAERRRAEALASQARQEAAQWGHARTGLVGAGVVVLSARCGGPARGA